MGTVGTARVLELRERYGVMSKSADPRTGSTASALFDCATFKARCPSPSIDKVSLQDAPIGIENVVAGAVRSL